MWEGFILKIKNVKGWNEMMWAGIQRFCVIINLNFIQYLEMKMNLRNFKFFNCLKLQIILHLKK